MKKILVAALLLTAPAFAMAQKPGGERRAPLTQQQRAEKQTERVDKIVSLTPEQRQKIAAQNLRTAEEMQPHVDNIRTERKKIREIGKQRHEAYASILTPEQMGKLKAEPKEHMQERGGRRMHGGRGMRPGGAEMQAAPAVKE